MPHFMECKEYVNPVLSGWNSRLMRPLSLLMVNAHEVECVSEWEPWVRRVAIFAEEYDHYYHMIASASELDLYVKFNFKLKMAKLNEVPLSTELTWPFDIVNITLDDKNWSAGVDSLDSWREFFAKQLSVAEEFLLIVQGKKEYVDALGTVLEEMIMAVGQEVELTKIRYGPYRSDNISASFCVWSVDNRLTRQHTPRTQEEEDVITEEILWGDESA